MKKNYILIFLIIIALGGQHLQAQYTKLFDFAGAANGKEPRGSLISDGTFLYGMTSIGGANGDGAIFKILPNGNGYVNLYDFAGGSDGRYPQGTLFYDGIFLYGTTYSGGTSDSGIVFKIKTDGTGYAKLIDFQGSTNGSNPTGALISDGTSVYGMTWKGGANNMGTIYKILTNGTGYTKLLDFSGTINGANPNGSLLSDGTFLYGMARNGGANNMGVVFKMMLNGSGYSKLLDFAGLVNGSFPYGDLISDGSFLYGLTYLGGVNDSGTVFKVDASGSNYSKLLDFTGTTNGSLPFGSLTFDGTYLYGMTAYGGLNNLGTVFKILPNGTGYSKILDFNGTSNGQWPCGGLLSDGTFLYGMTSTGGAFSGGVVFKLAIVTGIASFQGNNFLNVYPNPTNDHFFIDANTTEKLNVDLYDVNGRHVFSKNVDTKSSIDVTSLNEGVYTLTIRTPSTVINKKLVILR